ncbi:hypothetical protein MSAN_01513700 [Mycena sanguinolenta]|uniref:Uncharacterized protein n=1 Tax=Mycena sanguinolenta TaxID=230812 RepID=A0A8H6Y4R5_9AGAR|nr:hypothetical protein MSAN_02011800 [Mycena sanguinolenta]KAF7353258.1 hypothetical protein MSAN_01513700 [Mycena sanguinolenta]
MYILPVIYLASALILVVASPIANKPPSPATSGTAIASKAVPAQPKSSQPSSTGSQPDAKSGEDTGKGTDILSPIPLTNETLSHIGIEDEAHPGGPRVSCVIA